MSNKPRKITATASFIEDDVAKMKALVRDSAFPRGPPIPPKSPWKLGVDYEYLKSLKNSFESDWSWDDLKANVDGFDHFMVLIQDGSDALDLHFVHERSPRKDAIPLLLLHGWPGAHKVMLCYLSNLPRFQGHSSTSIRSSSLSATLPARMNLRG